LDISPSVLSDGTFSLIRYHLATQRQNLESKSRELFKNNEKLGSGAKVAALTWERLLANRNVIHHWQEVRLGQNIRRKNKWQYSAAYN
jgi:ubiquinone biosynthesis protein COQ9